MVTREQKGEKKMQEPVNFIVLLSSSASKVCLAFVGRERESEDDCMKRKKKRMEHSESLSGSSVERIDSRESKRTTQVTRKCVRDAGTKR